MTAPTDKDDQTIRAHNKVVSQGHVITDTGMTHEPESGNGLPIGIQLAEFEITGYVGDGGFSIVYLAWDHSLERQVALKEYMPSSLASRSGGTRVMPRSERHRETFEVGLRSFINEGKLLAQFDHPSLVKVYRFWEAHGTAYMVMPYYKGSTLKDTVRDMPQPPDEAWLGGLLDPLIAAVSVIHQAQCFHRDIAPDNVLLLADSGQPLLLDFGAARRVIGDKTQSLTVILKPGYAPIEQYAEDASMRQGAWTDVYAMAAVIYWAVTGKTPPVSVSRMLNDSYVPLTKCAAGRYSPRFLAAVDRALIVLPEKRTPSMAQLREELGLGVAGPGTLATVLAPADLDQTVIRPKPNLDAPPSAIELAAGPPAAASQSTVIHHGSPHSGSPNPTNANGSRRLWFSLAGMAVLAVGLGLWWMRQSAPLPASVIISAPPLGSASAPVPSLANSSPAVPAMPVPPPPTAQTVLTQIAAGHDERIRLSASLVTERTGATRLQYQASEDGYAYVMGLRTDTNELVVLYPLPGVRVAKLARSGQVDVPLPSVAGVPNYYLIWARASRDLAQGGWAVRDSGWVRNLHTTASPNMAATIWGTLQCAPGVARCDAAYAMTEVTVMTNVTKPGPASILAPSTGAKTPVTAPEKSALKRAEKTPPTEEKSASKRDGQLSAQCRELLSRASLGDTGPDVIEKMKTLRCGN